MTKSRRKKTKQNRGKVNLPPTTLLRSKLDLLWKNINNWENNQEKLEQELNDLVNKIKPSFFIPVMIKAYIASSSENQKILTQTIPPWLNRSDYLETLEKLVSNYEFDEIEQKIAMSWLETEGRDVSALIKAQEQTFYRAYLYEDSFGSQGILALFWYSNPQRNRVRGMNFLIDYNPPWEGAIKDIMYSPSKIPKDAIQDFINFWSFLQDEDEEMLPLEASEAKTKILLSLLCNRDQNIRLPRDLIACREEFRKNVLTLPDEEETPKFTMEDFEALSTRGETPEHLMNFEQNVGRRIRLDSGDEAIMLSPGIVFDEEE
jgi:hypothetical protein